VPKKKNEKVCWKMEKNQKNGWKITEKKNWENATSTEKLETKTKTVFYLELIRLLSRIRTGLERQKH